MPDRAGNTDWQRFHRYERKDQASARVQSIKPKYTRKVDTGIYEDRIAPIDADGIAIAIDDGDLVELRQVFPCSRSESVIKSMDVTDPPGPTTSARIAL